MLCYSVAVKPHAVMMIRQHLMLASTLIQVLHSLPQAKSRSVGGNVCELDLHLRWQSNRIRLRLGFPEGKWLVRGLRGQMNVFGLQPSSRSHLDLLCSHAGHVSARLGQAGVNSGAWQWDCLIHSCGSLDTLYAHTQTHTRWVTYCQFF